MAKLSKSSRFFIPTIIIAVLVVVFTIQLSKSFPLLSGSTLAETILPVPTLVPIKEANFKSEVHSPDGLIKIIVNRTFKSQSSANYTVSVSEISATAGKIIFTRSLGENQAIQVPENSFSPDNKYFFLKENDRGRLSFFVFKATGESFADGKEYIDVVPLFEDKKYEFKLSDITGWDSNNLLHIFTVKENDTKGPSFWFDVEGRNFYILSSR